MNKTEQAKIEMVKKMLKGQIDVEEVAMISGVPLETVQKLRQEMDDQERRMLGGLTVREVGYESTLIDNEVLDDEEELVLVCKMYKHENPVALQEEKNKTGDES